ncbi:tetratricopeptide repeat protein [Lentimicrobium sp. S6]|uniref:tetratricopeptide repeat protein n=1 Tax=Lentimicrobium sp. S6 TaxID=2735872 RepID=UPI0015551A20|nr:hypothetical protein [Lentimicrobium sp. S6]NPD47102.1 hypothetical protein [Lentimicrobium sp. S6]
MSKKLVVISFLLMLFSVSYAQEKMNDRVVDIQSYQLFREEKWPELIQLSEEARAQGIDFYYLQYRTGIAWYKQGKYRKACQYFIDAYAKDQSDNWLQEYVYYSLLFSGRKLEANKYISSFSQEVKEKIGLRKTAVDFLAYETNYGFNQDFDELRGRDFSSEVNLGEDYGEGYFLKSYTQQSLDLSHHIGSNFTVNHNLSYYHVTRDAIVNWGKQTSSPIRVNQFNYYINPAWVIGKKFNISPSLLYIWGTSDVYAGKLINNYKDKVFDLKEFKYSDYVFSTAFWSDFGNVSPGLELNIGNINNLDFKQLSAWITYYPLSNTKLFIRPRVYFKSSPEESFAFNTFEISAGASIGKIYISGQYLRGDMKNFVESTGYTVFNLPGKSDYKIMGSIYFPIDKKYQFVLRYINRSVKENYQVYTLGEKSTNLEYKYLIHTITAGISWKF